MVRDCRSKERRSCFKRNAMGQLARDCKSKKGHFSGTSRGPKKHGFFSFRSFEGVSEEGGLDVLMDSGFNGFMLKDRSLFKELDEAFNTDVGSFGMEANIRTQDGTLLPLVCTSDDLYTLRVLLFVCNLEPRALQVERLPGIAYRCGGRKGLSLWLGNHAAQSKTPVHWHRALGHKQLQ